MEKSPITLQEVVTKPYSDQKAGTSGLRKKVVVFQQENYLDNFVQSIFDSVQVEDRPQNPTLVVSGDGRFWNDVAIQKILAISAANDVHHVIIGQHGQLSTPAVSNLIRQLNKDQVRCMGGILLTASHNPGGPTEDFGIKFNSQNGGPALETLTNLIYEKSKSISRILKANVPQVDLSKIQEIEWKMENGQTFKVSVIDSCDMHVELMKNLFNFDMMKKLIARSDFSLCFDGMHGVSGPYARRLLINELGVPSDSLMRCDVLEDFGGSHPDPNLTYAPELVSRMGVFENKSDAPSFGAACDGDADRNMILGKNFFVTPSDSVAIITANFKRIPYLSSGIKGAARSMPTSAALDRVLEKLGLPNYETPTGWKFFGNLLDEGMIQICGEESFGTGSAHIREKDGLWAVLCWLQILADFNKDTQIGELISVEQIVREHWTQYGRNYYQRYDYEGLTTEHATEIFKLLDESMSKWEEATQGNKSVNFSYTDPVDHSVSENQGYIYSYPDGSRFVFRLSGTGSSGATIRIYLEKYSSDSSMKVEDALEEIAKTALKVCQIQQITGRTSPTVIT